MNQLFQWVVKMAIITFITATDSTSVTVNDSLHGALAGDFVTFSNAVQVIIFEHTT